MSELSTTFEQRAESVLREAFGWSPAAWAATQADLKKSHLRWELNYRGDLTTIEPATLTTLVFAAHRHCVRVQVSPISINQIRIVITYRTRGGDRFEYHPGIQKALRAYERSHS